MVFADKGYADNGAYGVQANEEADGFWDVPPTRHGNGQPTSFADGHTEYRKWMDKRTLEFIRQNAEDPSSHSGITLASPDNEDIHWLIKHFIEQKRVD